MANNQSLVSLKLDSGEYESKIKRAQQGLLAMEQECRKVGGTLAVLDKEQESFVRSLGQMETKSQTVRGKIGELSNAYTELRAQYNRLTDEEKKGDYGKALQQSLAQIRTRINGAKKELNGINGEINGSGNLLDQLSSKFGINIKQLGGWGAALAAGKVALDVLKDAFAENESYVDEWGRTVESSKAVYDGFLQSLNNGDIGGYLSRIDQIISAAKNAYNAFDELQTKATIISPMQAKIQAQMTEQKEIIRKQGKDSDAGKAAQKRLEALEKQMKQAYGETAQLNRDTFVSKVKERAAESGITLTNEMWQSFSDTSKFDAIRKRANGGEAHKWVSSNGGYGGHFEDTRNAEQKFLDTFTDEFRREASQYITAEWQAKGQAYSTGLADARYTAPGKGGNTNVKTENRTATDERKTAIQGLDFSSRNSIGGLEAEIAMYSKMYKNAGTDAGRKYAESMMESLKYQLAQLTGDGGLGEALKGVKIEIPDTVAELPEIGKNTAQAWQAAGNAISSIGSALMSIEDPAAKVAGTVAQAIASVALAAGQAMAAKDTTASGWAWIGAAASITATMISTIAAIKSATAGSFANGGVIGGNSYEGDRLYARVNSGETILNSSQASTLNRALDGIKSTSMQSGATSYVSGEQIISVINATGKRKHKGELVFG